MKSIKTIFGVLVGVVAVVGVVTLGAAQAFASSAPIVITYEKQCDASVHCVGFTGAGGTFDMQGANFRGTGNVFHFTVTETVTEGDISFTAELTATQTPAGFVVLSGRVTQGSFAGAVIHQRSDPDDPVANTWTGELQIMPASG